MSLSPAALVLALAAAAPPGDIEVRTSVDRTALWTGDRVIYTVEIACPPDVDVLIDDLAPEKLVLSGLEIVSADHERSVSAAGGVTYRYRYRLATYDVTAPALRIGEQSVRYYVRRAGQAAEGAAPAGEVLIGGVQLALRSTLPDEIGALALRDARAAAPLPAALTAARPVGLGLILVSAVPVALWAAALARRLHATRRPRRAPEARAVARRALDELRAVDASSGAERRAAYGRLDALLRRHLAETAGIRAPALTAAEIAARLRANASEPQAEAIGAVLEDCERARYGPAGLLPSAERFRAGMTAAEELLAEAR